MCGIPPLLLLSLVALIASPLHAVDCLIVIISLLLLLFLFTVVVLYCTYQSVSYVYAEK